MAVNNGFTPTEKRIMDVLGDFKPHGKAELKSAIDEMADDQLLYAHITNIREKLDRRCQNVVYNQRDKMYQLMYSYKPGYEE